MRKLLGAFTAFVLAALYAPIAVMTVFSFNESKYSIRWTGFTLDWYRKLAADTYLHEEFWRTLQLAAGSTVLATTLGTIAALAARNAFRGKALYATLIALPVMVPDIVLAISLRSFFRAVHIDLSLLTAIIAHTTFNLSYVAIVVSARLQGLDRSIELAGQDLGASPVRTFWKVTLPAILPGVASGAVLAFTLSFDDFVITYFTTRAGSGTLPMRIYSMVRFGVTPEMTALSTVILVASLALIVTALRISRVPVTGGGR
jgi:spermidine/putrescine transport system permease protein